MKLENFKLHNPAEAGIFQQGDTIKVATDCGWMWGSGNASKNLLLAPGKSTEVSVEITVEINPKHNGEQAGIVLFINEDNYIKLVREMVDDQHVIVLAKEINGAANVELLEPFESPSATLKLMRSNNNLSAFWKAADASDFSQMSFNNWFPADVLFQPGMLVHGVNPNNHATFRTFAVNGQLL